MSYRSLDLYSQLFNENVIKNGEYLRSFFEAPVHIQGLTATLKNISSEYAEIHIGLISELFNYGVEMLAKASGYTDVDEEEQEEKDIENTKNVEDIGEDIASMGPKISAKENKNTDNTIESDANVSLIRNVTFILTVFFQTIVKKNFKDGKREILQKILNNDSCDINNYVKLLKIIKQNLKVIEGNDEFIEVNIDSVYLLLEVLLTCNVPQFQKLFYEIDYFEELSGILSTDKLSNQDFGKILIINVILINQNIEGNHYKISAKMIDVTGPFNKHVDEYLTKFFCANLKFLYNLNDDLNVASIKNESFLNWITFNRFNSNLNLAYDMNELLDDKLNDESSLTLKFKDLKYSQAKEEVQKKNDNHIIPMKELLPTSLYLFSMITIHETFGVEFTSQRFAPVNMDETNPEDDKSIEIFELYLCLLSYIFQYQHNSIINQHISRLNLLILFKLITSESILHNIAVYKINEYKFQICHHNLPVVPNNLENGEQKSGLFYILDVMQCYLRFNLTNKLNLIDIKLVLAMILNILTYSLSIESIDENYQWPELFKTIFSLLLFIYKQNFIDFKNSGKVNSIIEEILIILNYSLNRLSVTIRFDLLYKILLNHKELNDILIQFELSHSQKLSNLTNALKFLNDEFDLDGKKDGISYNFLDLDQDSPELVKVLTSFLSNEENNVTIIEDTGYKYDETFIYNTKGDDLFRNTKISLVPKILEEVASDESLFQN